MVGPSRPSDSFWGGDGGGPSLGGPSPAPPRGLLEPLAGAEDEVDCFEHDFHVRNRGASKRSTKLSVSLALQ